MLKILERPVAAAGLGVLCAIALLLLLSPAGPLLTNNSQVPTAGPAYTYNSANQDTVTATASTTVVSSHSNSSYLNGTPNQAVTAATTTVSSAAVFLVSANPSPFFAFTPSNLSNSEQQTTTIETLTILAIFSLVVALGSMYFVKRRGSTEAQEIET